MPFGNLLSTFDGMVLASGETLEGVEYYASPFFKSEYRRTLNPLKYRAWKNDTQDILHRLGIFKKDDKTKETLLLRPRFFSYNGSFMDEFMAPFFHDVHKTVHQFSERFIVFAEPYINCTFPSYHGPPDIFDSDKFAWSPHWVRYFSLNVDMCSGCTSYLIQTSVFSMIQPLYCLSDTLDI